MPDVTDSGRGDLYQIPGRRPTWRNCRRDARSRPGAIGRRTSAARRSRRSFSCRAEHHSLCHFAEEVYRSPVHGRRRIRRTRDGVASFRFRDDWRPADATSADPLVSIDDLKVHFDLGAGSLWTASGPVIVPAGPSRRLTVFRSTSGPARRSASSGSQDAARRRWVARFCGWSSRRAAASAFAARTSPGFRRRNCAGSGATCR